MGIKEYYASSADLQEKIKQVITATDIVLDIGCGIFPINYFVPYFHILVEPWNEYVEVLKARFLQDRNFLIIESDGLSATKLLADNSVDSIFLLDVIEHLDKEEGLALIREVERVAKTQIIIFTPLGFMPQHVDENNLDNWGLNGGEFQEHKSGWTPSDFSDSWDFYICESFHIVNSEGMEFPKPFGAFYAIKNCATAKIAINNYFKPIFNLTANEILIQNQKNEIIFLREKINELSVEHLNRKDQSDYLNVAKQSL